MECLPTNEESRKPAPRIPLKIEENLAGIILALLGLITFANVVVRYLTNFSFAFTEEFSIFLMVVMTLAGSSSLMAKGGHLKISILVDKLPPGYRRKVEFGAVIITALTFLSLVILTGRMAWDEYRYEVTSPGLGIPSWWYTVWLPILFAAITARAAGLIIRMRGEKT
ncbi:MAG: TRAP transporter small permease [Syntrophobacteraceae bacterium]